MRSLFTFPDPVNETSARLVAGAVVVLCLLVAIAGQHWLLPVIAYGFVARVLTGPTLSPLGQLATRVVTPRLRVRHRFVPGPPKRFAQGMGAVMSVTALVAHLGFGATGVAEVLAAMIAGAALMEAAFAFCLGCKVFSALIGIGLIPQSVCVDCADITRRVTAA